MCEPSLPNIELPAAGSLLMNVDVDESSVAAHPSNLEIIPPAKPTLNIWDSFDEIKLPTSWIRCTLVETKSFIMIQLSRHEEPRLTVVKGNKINKTE